MGCSLKGFLPYGEWPKPLSHLGSNFLAIFWRVRLYRVKKTVAEMKWSRQRLCIHPIFKSLSFIDLTGTWDRITWFQNDQLAYVVLLYVSVNGIYAGRLSRTLHSSSYNILKGSDNFPAVIGYKNSMTFKKKKKKAYRTSFSIKQAQTKFNL